MEANPARSAQGRLILVTGGARSGKSRYALERAIALSRGTEESRVLFVATAEASDDEMRARILRHQRERPRNWTTLEAPQDTAQRLAVHPDPCEILVLDCLTLLVSNMLLESPELSPAEIEARVDTEISRLCSVACSRATTAILVTNEVGMGVHPLSALGRLFQNVAGRANQRVASLADEVILMVCGIPVPIKG